MSYDEWPGGSTEGGISSPTCPFTRIITLPHDLREESDHKIFGGGQLVGTDLKVQRKDEYG